MVMLSTCLLITQVLVCVIVAVWLFECMMYPAGMNICEAPMIFVITECKD